MNKFLFLILITLIFSCNTGNLKVIADLPLDLNEVSGIAIDKKNQLIWMVNDSGHKPELFGVDTLGQIKKVFKIKAKNRDWEDLTMDTQGNLYVGNFGNNENDSKKLSIFIVSAEDLMTKQKSIKPQKIKFKYPEQKKFPPKKSKRHFDCEAFFYFKNNLYLFTKSRDPKHPEITKLYQLPATAGDYEAEFISQFNTCEEDECWVTSVDINSNGTKMALLTENSVFVFDSINSPNFFSSKYKRYIFDYSTQKESVAFKNDSTLYIADEYLGSEGGNLYGFKIPKNE